MATRNSVLTKITAINDKGNNSAAEVRDVLTELLDYTENKTVLETFHIFSSNAIENFTQISTMPKEAKLFFSIKGIKGETANMTMLIKVAPKTTDDKNSEYVFFIPFDQDQGMFTEENFNLLAGKDGNGIIPLLENKMLLTFQVPIFNGGQINHVQLQMVLALKFEDRKNLLVMIVPKFNTGLISTSFSMHSHKFDEAIEGIGNEKNNNVDGKIRKTAAKQDSVLDIIKLFGKGHS